VSFEVTANTKAHHEERLFEMLLAHNGKFVATDFAPLSVYCCDDNGQLVAGLSGRTVGGYLEISTIWVEEHHRGEGIGQELLKLAESEARSRGCWKARLDTYDFQALSFYQRLGYCEFAALEDYYGRHSRHFLVKNLVE
jgi:ribosomal protein S18 acetylase RimI-like enzyme